MSLIYFLNNFNNYYNRVIKRDDSIQYYIDNSQAYALRGTSVVLNYNKGPVNFNINDGITADITYNYDPTQEWQPDYVLVVDDAGTTITSRWFVIEALRTRKGQYRINLRRDVVADNYNSILEAPTFIEKATLNNGDPMIFNNEDIDFNQIKTSETLLRDETGCAWIIGYMAKDFPEESYSISKSLNYNYKSSLTDITSYTYYNYCTNNDSYNTYKVNNYPSLASYRIYINHKYGATVKYYFDFSFDGNNFQFLKYTQSTTDSIVYRYTIKADVVNESYLNNLGLQMQIALNNKKTSIQNNLTTYYNSALAGGLHTVSEGNEFNNENNIHYKIANVDNVVNVYKDDNVSNTTTFNASSVSSAISTAFADLFTIASSTSNNKTLDVTTTFSAYYITISESSDNISFTIKRSNRVLNDAPYRMFAIPYVPDEVFPELKQARCYVGTSLKTVYYDFSISMAIAQAMTEKFSGDNGLLYDIQLLPYFPNLKSSNYRGGTAGIFRFDLENADNYTVVSSGSSYKSIIYWCDVSTDTFNIDYPISISNAKLQNQTDMWRFCSPSYDSVFEFNAARNNGLDFVNVDLTYKPYNSYIHVNPNFKNLYGYDFDDPRGLVCTGDFSIPQTTSAWETYQRNNVNYQKSFNRSIENMNYNHKFDMVASGLGAITSAVGTGTGIASQVGSAGIGALAGGISLAGGIADQFINQAKFNETIDYTKDQFGYQLGNIQALPNALSKVSSYTKNNKVFPYVEYYTCTKKEKDAFADKLKYNGMKVGRIGKISEFLQSDYSYIKGKIIRIENTSDDFHNVAAIAEELNKGVFIK